MERYKQLKKIGAGSFGTAQLCTVRATGVQVVIKLVDVKDMGEEERKAARREASILGALHHPAILQHIESFESDDGFLCIVTEFCERGDLGARIEERKGKPLAEAQVLDYFVQLCLAMLYCHKKRVLHRDLKLQNVFIAADNTVKLGDFGIARVLKNTMEMAKTVVGTPYFLSPEICENKPYNHKSDVWSAGCILYELLCQRHAFEANSITALCRKILKGQFEEPSQSYSAETRQLVGALLQLKPAARPAFQQVLTLPHLQPHLAAFVKRCAAKGQVVPYVDALMEAAQRGPEAPLPAAAAAAGAGAPEGAAAGFAPGFAPRSLLSAPPPPPPQPLPTVEPRASAVAPHLRNRPGEAAPVGLPAPLPPAPAQTAAKAPFSGAARAATPPSSRRSTAEGKAAEEAQQPPRAQRVSLLPPSFGGRPAAMPAPAPAPALVPPAPTISRPSPAAAPLAAAPLASAPLVAAPPAAAPARLRPSVLADPHFASPKVVLPRPPSAGGAPRPPSRDSRDSDSSVCAEELLEEADALLPHGLPLKAYKVAPAAAALAAPGPGMRLAAVATAATANGGGREPAAPLTLSIVPHTRRVATRRPVMAVEAEGKDERGARRREADAEERGSPSAGPGRALKFALDGETLNPAGSSEHDSLSYRVECLRVFLEAVMGEREFFALYRSIAEARHVDAASVDLTKTVRKALGKEKRGLLPLVFQLLWSEDQAFCD